MVTRKKPARPKKRAPAKRTTNRKVASAAGKEPVGSGAGTMPYGPKEVDVLKKRLGPKLFKKFFGTAKGKRS